MDNGLEFDVIGWERIVKLCLQLSEDVKQASLDVDTVIGILKGGAVVSRVVSDVLGKSLYNIRAILYEGIEETGEAEILQGLDVDISGERVLLVDDVVDTGTTLSVAHEYLQGKEAEEVMTAVVHVKPWAEFRPTYWVKETEEWIVYPWEYFEFLRLAEKKLNSDIKETEKKTVRQAMNKVQKKIKQLGGQLCD